MGHGGAPDVHALHSQELEQLGAQHETGLQRERERSELVATEAAGRSAILQEHHEAVASMAWGWSREAAPVSSAVPALHLEGRRALDPPAWVAALHSLTLSGFFGSSVIGNGSRNVSPRPLRHPSRGWLARARLMSFRFSCGISHVWSSVLAHLDVVTD